MKRLGWILLFFAVLPSAWAEKKKITLEQLKEKLISLRQEGKSEKDTNLELTNLELTEPLTPTELAGLERLSPGPNATGQLVRLAGLSSLLAPPATELPALPAPDLAAQKTILAKAVDYVLKGYMRNPPMTATMKKFPWWPCSENDKQPGRSDGSAPSWLDGETTCIVPVEYDKEFVNTGTQLKPKPTSFPSQPYSLSGPGPVLSVVLQEAAESGSINWSRWESLDGANVAVFSYDIDKKKSLYTVDWCCFAEGSPSTGPTDQIQITPSYIEFKKKVGFRGEFFIDPATGMIVRMVMQAGLSHSGYVHREDTRVDFGQVTVGGKTYMVPVDSFWISDVDVSHSPFEDSRPWDRVVIAEYGDYQLAGEKTLAQK